MDGDCRANPRSDDRRQLPGLYRDPPRRPIGSVSLAKITALAIQRYYAQLREAGRSARWIGYLHAVLLAALNDAVKWQIIPVNPALTVKVAAAPKREPPVW